MSDATIENPTVQQAIVVDPDAPSRLTLKGVLPPAPGPDELVMRVVAASLNRGELRAAQSKPAGARIGWDVAGIVEQAAEDGSGPAVGARVVGFLPQANGWSLRVAATTRYVAEIPEGVSDEDAAALPVAGLTALYGLERASRLLGARVLITGASGGVGLFAVQLAHAMGAHVVAQVRRDTHADVLSAAGAAEVIVDDDGDQVVASGSYRAIFDGVGGPLLAKALMRLETGGTAIAYGVTASPSANVSLGALLGSGSGRLEGFNLYHESRVLPPTQGLERLLRLVAEGRLKTHIERTADWSEIGELATAVLEREIHGKAVMNIS
ncbi:MAG: zinc-binding dehydrogenase [Myxococcales bacterium]|nr:zinc-binding dehydrogenase [Myxococcales bacterium]